MIIEIQIGGYMFEKVRHNLPYGASVSWDNHIVKITTTFKSAVVNGLLESAARSASAAIIYSDGRAELCCYAVCRLMAEDNMRRSAFGTIKKQTVPHIV